MKKMQGSRLVRALGLLAGMVLAAPALAQTPAAAKGFVWLDCFSADPAASSRFYTQWLGWSADAPAADGSIILRRVDGRPVAGIMKRPAREGSASKAAWVGYLGVDDPVATAAMAVTAGGRQMAPLTDLPNRGKAALIATPDGVPLGLMANAGGIGLPPGTWVWGEYFAADTTVAGQFLQQVLAWENKPDERTPRTDDFLLAANGQPHGGMALVPAGRKPTWLGFLAVDKLEPFVARLNELGGKVLLGPKALDEEHRILIVADPLGATLALMETAPAPEIETPGVTK
ncbi:MAG: VOC family protein [Pedobacter sp.]|nr:VOC family protein [Pedobacter sp.]